VAKPWGPGASEHVPSRGQKQKRAKEESTMLYGLGILLTVFGMIELIVIMALWVAGRSLPVSAAAGSARLDGESVDE
jgi:hypothetical protein